MRFFRPLLFLTVLPWLAFAEPNQHAVIIGVADYPHLSEDHALIGPKNDAVLITNLLRARGFPADNIVVMTDAQPDPLLPNKGNIERVLDEKISQAKSGDFLYLHFSGHGSQQPDPSGEEIDGMNEIFLPRDTMHWDGTAGTVVNAITDDEIASYLEGFRTKGVFVWLVFDSCHSGTMTRSTWRSRKLAPSALGVPKTRSAGAKQQESNILSQQSGYVAFFAAQTTEETPEMLLPKRTPDPQVLGLFTYQIMEALQQNPTATYRQIADQVMQNYMAQPWYGSTPMFVGDEMDREVFGGAAFNSSQHSSQQWPISFTDEGWQIPAGYLHGLNSGTRLLALKNPTDTEERALGEVMVTENHATFSELAAIGDLDLPPLAYARVADRGLPLGLSLARIDSNDYPMSKRATVVLDNLDKTKFSWVAPNAPADIRFVEINRKLVLLTDGEPLPCQPNTDCVNDRIYVQERLLGNPTLIAATLEEHLAKITKALNLMRLGTVLGLDGLETQLHVTRAGTGEKQQFGPSEVPTLLEGDKLSLLVANYLEDPLDITVLFVSNNYSIDVVFPRGNSFNRFMLEEERSIPLGTINVETTGLERVVVIATKASKTGTPANYSFLAQPGLSKTRSSNVTPMTKLFQDAGFSQFRTRSTDESLSTQADIHTISWVTKRSR